MYHQNPAEVAFRVLLFKLFNLESTWECLLQNVGIPTLANFSVKRYGEVLDNSEHIYNNAYMMSGIPAYGYQKKHWNHLALLEVMVNRLLVQGALFACETMQQVYAEFMKFKLISNFLAYQYTLDLNYSNVIDFDENSFVGIGSGTARGIARCFEILKIIINSIK